MAAVSLKDLQQHIGHPIECVVYGDAADPSNVALECRQCNEVLLDFDADEPEPG